MKNGVIYSLLAARAYCYPYSDHRENCACATLRSIFLEEIKADATIRTKVCAERVSHSASVRDL